MEFAPPVFDDTKVVASRLLAADGRDVTIRIGQPASPDEGLNWFCPWQVSGPEATHELFTGGADSMQALVFALVAASDYALATYGPSLTSLGTSDHNLIHTSEHPEPGYHVGIVRTATM